VPRKSLNSHLASELDDFYHELIKVRAASLDRHAREEAFSRIAEKTRAEPVQHIGKVFVLFRKKNDE